MFTNKKILKSSAFVFSLFALLTSSKIFAEDLSGFKNSCPTRQLCRVEPAQANYQDETTLIPAVDQPIPFTVKNFRTNVEVNSGKTIFEVKVPGLYSLDAFLLVSLPAVDDAVEGYITINGRKLLTFFEREERTNGPVVQFHFNDRLVYLKKGDEVSVILSSFPDGTTVLSRGFVMINYNNSN